MRFLYIGQNSDGTTSRMRAFRLRELLNEWEHQIIDTHIPFYRTNRLFRSFGFRFKHGPLITGLNKFVRSHLKHSYYDLIWVDKAVFISKASSAELRRRARKLIHYTPDAAFYENSSAHFFKSMPCYDFLITTKSYEKAFFLKYISEDKLLLTTQGFDQDIHKPFYDFENKSNCVVFIGLWEPARAEVIQKLIDSSIKVLLAGQKWEMFVSRNSTNPYLEYVGADLIGHDYSRLISSALFSIGCVSKRFPELHTTRTFEIPACGTALLTERNEETSSFFDEDEVIFYDNLVDLVNKVKYYGNNLRELKLLTSKGMLKVNHGSFDYRTILKGLLEKILN